MGKCKNRPQKRRGGASNLQDLGGRSRGNVEPLEARRLLSTTVSFENLAIGPVGNPTTGVYDDPSGFRFTLRAAGGGSPGKTSQIYGAPQGFPSKVLHAAEWGQQYLITRTDGQSFDLEGFDRAASRYGDAGDFVLTGTFAGGGTQQQAVAFSGSKTPQTLALDWTNLTQVRIAFAGGVNSAFGALDNFVFDDAGDEPPTTTGSLADPDPAAGPVKVKFDGQAWHEARQIAPLANGSFYLVGRSGSDPYTYPLEIPAERQDPETVDVYVTRHLPSGSIDTTFRGDGRATPGELGWGSDVYELTPLPAGGFLGVSGDRIVKLDGGLALLGSFGSAGSVTAPSNRGLAIFTDGGFATLGNDSLRIYGAAGALIRQASASEVLEPVAWSVNRSIRGLGVTGTSTNGALFIGVTNNINQDFNREDPHEWPYIGAARLHTDLTLDTNYGLNGAARWGGFAEHVFPESLFVSPDGRVLLTENESDGDMEVDLFDAAGELMFTFRYYSELNGSATADAPIRAAMFHDDGDVSFVVSSSPFKLPAPKVWSDNRQEEFAVWRVNEDGTFEDGQFGPRIVFTSPDNPVDLRDVAVLGEHFLIAGFAEQVTQTGLEITDIDHVGAVWAVDTAFGRDSEEVVVDYESAAVGQIASGLYTEDGFTFSNRPGAGGSALEPLIVHGASQGYASKVLSTTNWGRRIDIVPAGGGSFDLTSFDYAAGRWGDAGDFVLTGHFAGGGTQTRNASFSSKQLATLAVGWEDLERISINFAGGVNSAYGAVDNFVFGEGDDGGGSTVGVNVEPAAVGQIPSGLYTEDGFSFFNRPGSGGSTLQPLVVHGPSQGYASKVLSTTNWGRRIDVARDGGGTFDLTSFDYAAGRWGEAGDFVLTGSLAGGGTQTQTVSFSSKAMSTLSLNWQNLTGLSINFAGGVNNAYGAVDNFLFVV